MSQYSDIRDLYVGQFKENGHAVIPSAPLVPLNDPTTLFTSSGMQPLVPYLLGAPHPAGKRLVNSQKCFRAEDIEEIGDNRHTTFFEMLGNWSLGDYFKHEQLPWFFEFLTERVGLDPKRLYVTVFDGDTTIGIPRDDEAIKIWQSIFSAHGISNEFQAVGSETAGYETGMREGARIFSYEAKKNWWSRSGVPQNMPEGEIGGPDSEVFYDFGVEHDPQYGRHCHPNCDCGRFMEIGNSVFIQYIKKAGGFELLPQKNVDFGGGLERIVAALHGSPDVFTAGVLGEMVKKLESLSGARYESNTRAFRVVADHVRGAIFMIGDGILPGNTEQGYFVRRLLRRAVRYADHIGIPEGTLAHLTDSVVAEYGMAYPELSEHCEHIKIAITAEEKKFRETLVRGLKEFEKIASLSESTLTDKTVPAQRVFELITTFGFPFELIQEIARERGLIIPDEQVRVLLEEHRTRSSAGAEKRFKGGLADTSEETTRLHTAHHLLLKALQCVLGPQVKQRGSNITAERLRIDFSHGEKMTEEQKREVERIVNEKMAEALPVTMSMIPRSEAEHLGAEMEFGQKYPEVVSVYAIGPKEVSAEHPDFKAAFSLEFCGGPHVSNTSELLKSGTFRILKEEASSAGVRRIKAVLGA